MESDEIPEHLLLQAQAEEKRWNELKGSHEYLLQARELVVKYTNERADAMIVLKDKNNVTNVDLARFLKLKPERISEIISKRRYELGS